MVEAMIPPRSVRLCLDSDYVLQRIQGYLTVTLRFAGTWARHITVTQLTESESAAGLCVREGAGKR